jgi:hypothetical protein
MGGDPSSGNKMKLLEFAMLLYRESLVAKEAFRIIVMFVSRATSVITCP